MNVESELRKFLALYFASNYANFTKMERKIRVIRAGAHRARCLVFLITFCTLLTFRQYAVALAMTLGQAWRKAQYDQI